MTFRLSFIVVLILALLALAHAQGGGAQTKVVLPGGNRPTPNCQSPNKIATADKGDTLNKIAQDTGVKVSKLAQLNPQINSNGLQLNKGDQICVPPRAVNG